MDFAGFCHIARLSSRELVDGPVFQTVTCCERLKMMASN